MVLLLLIYAFSHDSVLSTYIPRYYVPYPWEINLLTYLKSRSISGLFFGINGKNWILSIFTESLFAFKDLNSIFVTFLKSSRLELINITLEAPTHEAGVDLSLIDLIDLLCTSREEKLKDVKLIHLEKQCL